MTASMNIQNKQYIPSRLIKKFCCKHFIGCALWHDSKYRIFTNHSSTARIIV